MSASNPLRNVGQLDDCILQRIGLGVFGREGDAFCALRHTRITEPVRIGSQPACEPCHFGAVADEFGVLDGVDPLGECDHEPIDVLRELGDVFLGGSNRGLVFEHRASVIGRCGLKLERNGHGPRAGSAM
jgi:hypothetical protein